MIILSDLARDDLTAIAMYTQKKWGKSQRDVYINGFNSAFSDINSNPQLGKERPEIQTSVYSRFHQKHTVFYQQDGSKTIILRILHQSRDVLKAF